MSKNYELLRPFDLEKAQQGEPICSKYSNNIRFVGLSDTDATTAICEHGERMVGYFTFQNLYMEPLEWVDGKPVYKGDTLYQTLTTQFGEPRKIVGKRGSFLLYLYDGVHTRTCSAKDLTWARPKQKREGWINIYHSMTQNRAANTSHAFKTREEADKFDMNEARIACVHVTWEE